MNWLIRSWLMVLISAMLTIQAVAQEQNQQELKKSDRADQTKLMDQNQNKDTQQNRARNEVIHGVNFVDKNGDGYHDMAPDHDKDGIPNGQDQDYQGAGKGKKKASFQDTDGNGIADNNRSSQGKFKNRSRRDGYGPGSNCDGTGPKRSNTGKR